MGKSNRIKANHAEKKIVTPVKHKESKGMPLWLKSTIAAVVALAVLAVCLMGLISSNGIIGRYRRAMYTENFTVSENMFTYMFMTQYSNFVSQNSNYLASYGLDTTKSLKSQPIDESGKTWYAYFEDLAVKQATQLLLFCEEANARNLTLDDDDKLSIDSQIEEIKLQASSYASVNAYISANYGEGIKIRDIRKVLELSVLATKAQVAIQDDIEAGITDEEIQQLYDKDAKIFDNIDYSTYSITVTYKNVATDVLGKSDYTDSELEAKKDDVLKKYREEIETAKGIVKDLEKSESVDDFNKQVFELLAEKQYDTRYEANELEDSDIPEDAVVDTVKAIVVKNIVDAIVEEKESTSTVYTESEGTYKIGENTVTKAFAEFIDKTQSTVFTSVLTATKSYIVEKATYVEDDKFSTWAYDSARKINDTTTLLVGDGEGDGEITNEKGSFTASAYILKKTQYRDDELSKNFVYSVYSSEAAAKVAIEEFSKGTISVDAFKTVATNKGATGTAEFESYV